MALLATMLLPAAADAAVTCRGKTVTINMNTNGGSGTGTPGNDVILGTSGADTIRAGSGVDTICAGYGNDLIYGEGGSDRIRGEGGNDTIWAGSGADDVWGGSGHDVIYGQGGQDDIWGESGNDTIQGNQQSDKLYGGDGNDRVAGADGIDQVYGDAGDDELFGGNNTDYLYGGAGNDTLNGQAGNDTADGGAGTDDCVNTETETNCGPADTTPPAWLAGQVSVDIPWRWDFTLSWPESNDPFARYIVNIYDSEGERSYFDLGRNVYEHKFDTFEFQYSPGDIVYAEVTSIDEAGNVSSPLELEFQFPVFGRNPERASASLSPALEGAIRSSGDGLGFAAAVDPTLIEAADATNGRCLDFETSDEFGFSYFLGWYRTGSHYVHDKVCHEDGAVESNQAVHSQKCERHGLATVNVTAAGDFTMPSAGTSEVINTYECVWTIHGTPVRQVAISADMRSDISHRYWRQSGLLYVHSKKTYENFRGTAGR